MASANEPSVPRRPTVVALLVGALGALLVACSSGGGSARPATAYPVVLLREGGVAGFADRADVDASGLVRVVPTRREASGCRLSAAAARTLAAGLAAQSWAPGSTEPTLPDELVALVAVPGRGPARITDPGLAELVSRLFDGPSRADCTPEPGGTSTAPPGPG